MSELISAVPILVLKILKIVNCPFYLFHREITNLREAVIKLGMVVVKQWAFILSLVASSEQPTELFRTLLIRSKACNLFALSIKKVNAEDYFIIGLFTGLDAVLDIDRVTLLNNIYFPTHVKEELMFFDKKEKSTLALVIAYERGQFLSSKVINKLDKAYWEATVWADDLMQSIMSK